MRPRYTHGDERAVVAQRRAGLHARHQRRARDGDARVPARRRAGSARGPRCRLSVTYANELESYQIFEEARNDPTFRDDLIALGLDPRHRQRQGDPIRHQRRIRAQHDELACSTRARATCSRRTSSRPGRCSAARSTTPSSRPKRRVYRAIGSRLVAAGQVRLGSIDDFDGSGKRRAVLQALLPRRRLEPARVGPLRSRRR